VQTCRDGRRDAETAGTHCAKLGKAGTDVWLLQETREILESIAEGKNVTDTILVPLMQGVCANLGKAGTDVCCGRYVLSIWGNWRVLMGAIVSERL